MVSDEQSIRIIVRSGSSDHELRNAIHAAGKRSFAKAAARAFAGMAALGEGGVAAEIVRVWSSRARKTWCTDDTLFAARKVFGRDDVVAVSCPGREKVVLSGSIMSSPHDSAKAELATMVRRGDIAGALGHSCALLEHGCGDTAWEAVLACAPRGEPSRYVASLRTLCEACGSASAAAAPRRMLMEAAVAVASGELNVRRPSLHQSDEMMRYAAMYCVQKKKTKTATTAAARPRRKTSADGGGGPETKRSSWPANPDFRPGT